MKGIVIGYFIVLLVGIVGYIRNIVELFGANFNDLTGELVLRVIGVLVPPLGAIMGFL